MNPERECDKPADWEDDVVLIRNPDGTITELKEDEDAPDT